MGYEVREGEELAEDVTQQYTSYVNETITDVNNILDDIKNFFSNVWDSLVGGIQYNINLLTRFFTVDLPNILVQAWRAVEDWRVALRDQVLGAVKEIEGIIGGVKDWLKGEIETRVENVVKVSGEIQLAFSRSVEAGLQSISNALNPMVLAFQNGLSWMMERWNELTANFKLFYDALFNPSPETISKMYSSMLKAIGQVKLEG